MSENLFISFNGNIVPFSQPVLRADNRGYRFADLLFETMKWKKGKIHFFDLHWERLHSGLQLLGFTIPPSFNPTNIINQVNDLAGRNILGDTARIRLSCSRGNGMLNPIPNLPEELIYIIECFPAPRDVNFLNEEGITTGIYEPARKAPDAFSHLKSSNFLAYRMAAIHAFNMKWDNAIILNSHDRIADATGTNVFLVSTGNSLITPPLSEGPVAGVMRKHLLEKLPQVLPGLEIIEKPVTRDMLKEATEIFLTNSITGIRWVKTFAGNSYANTLSADIYQKLLKTIWQ
jgi:branched-chain amino acid aminotransferase